jgi:hypothetical protein
MRSEEEHRKVFLLPCAIGTSQRGPTEPCSKMTPAAIKGGPGERHPPADVGKAIPYDPYYRTNVRLLQGREKALSQARGVLPSVPHSLAPYPSPLRGASGHRETAWQSQPGDLRAPSRSIAEHPVGIPEGCAGVSPGVGYRRA